MSHRLPPSDAADLANHAAGVKRLARRLVGGAEADDVAQEALARAMERPRRSGYSLGGWLRGITRNVARERRRADVRRTRREQRAQPSATTSPDVAAAALRLEQVRTLADAMARLPAAYRAVLWWRYFADMTPKDIGGLLDEPSATVRTRLRRALERLRDELDSDHGGDDKGWRATIAPLAGLVPVAKGVAVATATKWMATGVVAALLLGMGAALVAWAPWDDGPEKPAEPVLAEARSSDGATLAGRAAPKDEPAEPVKSSRPLTVTVLASGTGEPIADVVVRVYRHLPGVGRLSLKHGPVEGRADARGQFRTAVQDSGPLCVVVSAPGFLAAAPVPVEDTSPLAVEVRLDRGAVLAGHVVLPDGSVPAQPVTIRLVVFRRGTSGPALSSRTTTKAGGAFRLDGLRPGNALLSVAYTQGDRRYIGKTVVAVGERDLTIRLREPQVDDRVTFVVQLQDARGTPVEAGDE